MESDTSPHQNPRPLVSVILSAFNGERYLSKQIDSILAQTCSNLELIICDDCSSDGTLEIAKEYARKDPRVKWVRNKTNIGIAATFQQNCHLCQGEFIAPSDQDDIWLAQKLEKQVAFLASHPEVNLVFTDDMVVNDDASKELGSYQQKLGNPSRGGLIPIGVMLKRHLPPWHVTCFRRSLFDKILPVPEESTLFIDAWVVLAGALTAPVGYINECLVLYRQHQKNVVGSWTRNYGFYFKRLNDAAFLSEYFKDKSGQLAAHRRLFGFGGTDSAMRSLKEKIQNEAVLVSIVEARDFRSYISRLLTALVTILKSEQEYHLQQWAFLALSWGGIKRLHRSGLSANVQV